MLAPISPLLSAHDLLKIDSSTIILIDATNGGQNDYASKHLEGAVFVDLNTQLADIKSDYADGGRHPLPSIQAFLKTVAQLGISKTSHVVVYDTNNGANAASRLWWMLKAIGIQKVQVLDGGMKAAEKINFPTTSIVPHINPVAPIKEDAWLLPTADINEVENASVSKKQTVIDVRENARYKGLTEPIDLIAGHIPGALNIPFQENLNADGSFLSPDELKKKYEGIIETLGSDNVIVHCGSGVTACHTLLALDYAGFAIPKLYVGSWSEWSRNGKQNGTHN